MPAHNGVHIALISQYDAMLVPEYCPPTDGETNEDENNDDKIAASHHIDTYIPNYAASQFWVRYACDAADQGPTTRFYYFKLYVAGKFAVAWGCRAQDGCMGETLFVPNDVRSGEEGPREKLGLFFPRDSEVQNPAETPSFEIRVHRARARKRQERQHADIDQTQGAQGSVHLNAIGIVERGDPRRFYTYALLDPKDEPYVCFRYHFRTYGDLQDRGFVRRRGIRIILRMQVEYREFTDPFDNAHDHVSVAESSTPRQNSSPRQSTIRIVEEDEEE